MQALVLEKIGELNICDVKKPVLEKGEVLVEVKACGICGSDIPRAFVNGAHKMPLIIGHEFSGIVREVTDGSDKDLIGQPVGVFPLIPCRECGPCKMGKFEMCRNYNYLGSRTDGGFAEYVKVPSRNLIPLGEGVDLRAAAMLEPMSVAVHACRRLGLLEPAGILKDDILKDNSKLKANEELKARNNLKDKEIVICGMGTIGLLVLMFLLEAGYKNISAIGNRELQKKKAIELGLAEDRFFYAHQIDSKMSDIKVPSADFYFECVGKNETVVEAIENTNPAGSICLVGNPYSDMELPRDTYWKILRNQLTVTGTWNSSFTESEDDDWHYVVRKLRDENIHPEKLITHTFGIESITDGFYIMKDKTEDYIKVMMRRL